MHKHWFLVVVVAKIIISTNSRVPLKKWTNESFLSKVFDLNKFYSLDPVLTFNPEYRLC